MSIRKIIQVAKDYKNQGANVIDLGCMPDTKFDHLEDTIKALKCDGFKVSVDSANSEELIRGAKSGADFILSVNEKNLHILDEVKSVPVVIPSNPGDLKSLERTIKKLEINKRAFFCRSNS